MKQWFISQSVDHPKRSILLTLIFTLLMGTGLMYFTIEDDFMKMLPQDIESMVTWNALKDEFGSTDLMFMGFGIRGKDALNKETLAALWDVSHAMEEIPMVDEIMSIATMELARFREARSRSPSRSKSWESRTCGTGLDTIPSGLSG